jgi:hypothetical protein
VSLNETCSEGCTDQYLSDVYGSEFYVKQEDISALIRSMCAIVYGIIEFTANGKNSNGTGHWRFCSVVIMLIYWDKTYFL